MTAHRSLHEVTLNLPSVRPHQRGFTLIELIMVIFMLGVLAMFAAPRIFYSNDFNTHGFHDETLSLLRYAQKAAIAQRRVACVTFTATTGTLSITKDPTTAPTCDIALTGPNKSCPSALHPGSTGCITARGGVTYSIPVPGDLRFDGLGQPVDSAGNALPQAVSINVKNVAATIKVEAFTGYVHDD